MEDDIKATREKRSRLKTRMSMLAKQLSTATAMNQERTYSDLNQTYADFLETHYAYCELVQSEERFADWCIVSNLNLDEYLAQVEANYNTAVHAYTDRQINSKALDVDILLERAKLMSDRFSTRNFDPVSIDEAETVLFQCNQLFKELCVFDPNHILCAKLAQCIREFDVQVLNAKQSAAHPRVGFDTVTSSTSVNYDNSPVTSYSKPRSNPTLNTTNTLSHTPLMHQGIDVEQSADPPSHGLSGAPGSSRVHSTILSNARTSVQPDPRLSIVAAYQLSTQGSLLTNPHHPLIDRDSLDNGEEGSSPKGGRRSRFKKSSPPVFSGNRREWAEFRAVWQRYGEVEFTNDEERAWALKGCLKGKALDCVRAIYATQPNAYARIWYRLDSIYSDIGLSVQAVYEDLKRLRPVKEEDLRGLVRFVNEVELSYSQLGEISQIESITMTHVDELCDLLPIVVRKEWMKTYSALSVQEKIHPFPSFMAFLEQERGIATRLSERENRSKSTTPKSVHQAEVQVNQSTAALKTGSTNSNGASNSVSSNEMSSVTVSCLIHNKPGVKHKTEQCSKFKDLLVSDRLSLLKKNHACFRCLGSHKRVDCTSTSKCSVCQNEGHHPLLCKESSNTRVDAGGYHSQGARDCHTVYPIREVPVVGVSHKALVFFDGGSNASFVTFKAAEALKARRLDRVNLDLTTMGKHESSYSTYIYELKLVCKDGSRLPIHAYGMEQITGEVQVLDQRVIHDLFPDFSAQCAIASRQVDILIGNDYYGLHPKKELARAGEHLSLMEGPLGVCIQGRCPDSKEETSQGHHPIEVISQSHHVQTWCLLASPELNNPVPTSKGRVDDFIGGESAGTEVFPKCGGCRCSKCPLPGHTYSFNEEREIAIIRENLKYDPQGLRWVTKYPWVRDPASLPNNYSSALATLKSTERKLKQDEQWAKIYTEQIEDMVNREVARKLTSEELASWQGPLFYISHLAVVNPKSSTTPVRIVFNSSQKFQGVSLNSYLAKGPDSYLNNLLGILLRWREEKIVLISDIRKMYNSIFIEDVEQHCHRFLWRDLQEREPDVYVMVRVNMGDRPAAAISTEAIYKTAELFQVEFPAVTELLRKSTYVDDIVHSVPTPELAEQLKKDTDEVLRRAGFTTKGWALNKECRVLGVLWDSEDDKMFFKATLNFSPKKKGLYTSGDLKPSDIPQSIPEKLTRRVVLEQVMRLYDPLGLLCPFTLQAKVLLRTTWQLKLGWDEAMPTGLRLQWIKFFTDLYELSSLRYDRCLSPSEKVGDPVLIVLSDGSDTAYGASAYVRWQLSGGRFWSRLIMAKSRIAPQRRVSTPQMELNGAVLSKRIRKVVEKECRLQFSAVYHLLDSSTVLNMVNKLSTRFRLYEGVRIGEIQAATNGNMEEWYWLSGQDNIADWVTRSKSPCELGPDSRWWQGPAFLCTPTEEWPIRTHKECLNSSELPGEKKPITSMVSKVHESFMDYSRFHSAVKVVWTLAIVIAMLRQKSFLISASSILTPDYYNEAKTVLIRDAQREVQDDCSKLSQGRYARLNPKRDPAGIWRVGYRMSRHNPLSKDPRLLPILLPSSHKLTSLFMRDAHVTSGHRGRDATLSRFRQQYWTPQGSKLARAIRNRCQMCRLRDSRSIEVPMGQLPLERLQPGRPPFYATMVDLFGPYIVRGEVQRRVSGKAYGVIFTDLASRAVHVEGAFGYDTASFMLALTRFVCLRGWPDTIYSDPGSQLVGADKELQVMWREMDRSSVYKQGAENGTTWIFGPADSPWCQGAVEALVKATKRCFKFSFGNHRLSPSEFLTVCAQATNILNERPLGVLNTEGPDISILTPNCLLLGRPHAANPGHWGHDAGIRRKLQAVDEVTQTFWERWVEVYPPTLLVQRKWKREDRSLKVGDVVVVPDSNSLRGQYHLALVKEVFPGKGGRVGQVALEYRNFRAGEKVNEYKGVKGTIIYRSPRRLALLVPVDDDGPWEGCGRDCSR